MEYSVDKIPGQLRIDPEVGAHGQRQGKQHKRARQAGAKPEVEDRIDISEEARWRSSHEDDGEPELPPAI